jgi:hypothetical protein
MNVVVRPTVGLSSYIQDHKDEVVFGPKDQLPSQQEDVALKRKGENFLSRTVDKIDSAQFPGSRAIKFLFATLLAITVVGIPVLIYWKWQHDLSATDKKTQATAIEKLTLQNTLWNERAAILQELALPNFQKCPVLDLGDRMGPTGYIDFLKPTDLSAPVMKGVDKFQRPFIALKLRDKDTEETEVLTLFQRYTDGQGWTWGSVYGLNAYKELNLPGRFGHNSDIIKTLKEIVAGRHGKYMLGK